MIRDVCSKLRLHDLVDLLAYSMLLAMLTMKKGVAWFSISLNACI